MQNLRPDALWSCTIQRWFGRARTGAAALVPRPACCSAAASLPGLPHDKYAGLIAVDYHAISAQQDVQMAIAEPMTLVGQLTQLLTQLAIVVPCQWQRTLLRAASMTRHTRRSLISWHA
jgi:hypothetical protein